MTATSDKTTRVVGILANQATPTVNMSDAGIMHVLIEDKKDAVILVGTVKDIGQFAIGLIEQVVRTADAWVAAAEQDTKK